jgi:hypothetical protein
MYWYNPTTHSSEKVPAPSNDSQAIQMLAGTQDSAEFVKEYCQLRRSGTPIEQVLVLVGHEFRMRQPEKILTPGGGFPQGRGEHRERRSKRRGDSQRGPDAPGEGTGGAEW